MRSTSHFPSSRRALACAVAGLAVLLPSAALAEETAHFLNAPAKVGAPTPRLAVQYELKLRLPEGRGLARLLIDAGVDQGDAAEAAKLAAGHLGSGVGGCDVQVSISRNLGSSAFSLVRATLLTAADRTVIEKHGSELTIASETAARAFPRLI